MIKKYSNIKDLLEENDLEDKMVEDLNQFFIDLKNDMPHDFNTQDFKKFQIKLNITRYFIKIETFLTRGGDRIISQTYNENATKREN